MIRYLLYALILGYCWTVAQAQTPWRPVRGNRLTSSSTKSVVDAVKLASVRVHVDYGQSQSHGSGTFIAPRVVLTAKHVVNPPGGRVWVDGNGWSSWAKVSSQSPRHDLALLQTDNPSPHPPAKVMQEPYGLVRPSEVFAVGYPSGRLKIQHGQVVQDRWNGPGGSRWVDAVFSTTFQNQQGASGGGAFRSTSGHLGGVINTNNGFADTVAIREFLRRSGQVECIGGT